MFNANIQLFFVTLNRDSDLFIGDKSEICHVSCSVIQDDSIVHENINSALYVCLGRGTMFAWVNEKTSCAPLGQVRGAGWVVSGLCHGLTDGTDQKRPADVSPRTFLVFRIRNPFPSNSASLQRLPEFAGQP